MAAKKFTVTHPDGTVSKRSSQSREYTHAVVEAVQRQYFVDQATDDAQRWEQAAVKAAEAAKSDHLAIETGDWIGSDQRHTAYLGGEYVGAWNTDAEGNPTRYTPEPITLESARETLKVRHAEALNNAARNWAKVEEAKALPEVVYSVPRWSSREDLAIKAANGEFAPRSRYITVSVKPVD